MIYTKDNPKKVKDLREATMDKSFVGYIKTEYNCIAFVKNGIFDETDGPSAVYESGDSYWYVNHKLHRKDGPAVEYANGDKLWCLNDKLYGENDDFTNESWIRFVRLELLE